jgi:hypothetical protein
MRIGPQLANRGRLRTDAMLLPQPERRNSVSLNLTLTEVQL